MPRYNRTSLERLLASLSNLSKVERRNGKKLTASHKKVSLRFFAEKTDQNIIEISYRVG